MRKWMAALLIVLGAISLSSGGGAMSIASLIVGVLWLFAEVSTEVRGGAEAERLDERETSLNLRQRKLELDRREQELAKREKQLRDE